MRKNYKYFKYIAFVLSLVMIMCSMSMVSYATYEDETIVEVEALREENVKHFKLPDGTYTAMVYDSAVHRKDENGEWQDIDNRMTEKNANNKQAYITSDGRTVFFKKINSTDNTVFELNENGYTIKVHFDEEEIKNTTAKLSNHAEKYVPDGRDDIETQYKKLKTLNTSTTVEYKNVLKGVNLEYVISSNDIKENIIVNKPREEYAYSFIYELKGLSAVLTESNSIELRDTDSEEAIYVIPTPYMYDSAGEISYDVAYSIIELETGKYKLTVTANEEWINDTNREFPVVIDPTTGPSAALYDTYISAVYPDQNYSREAELWLSEYEIIFMCSGPYLPTILPDNATITYCALNIRYYYHITTGSINISFYPMLYDWTQYNDSITWNSASAHTNMGISSTPIGVATATAGTGITSSTPGIVSIDATNIVKDWVAGKANYGIALKRTGGNNNSVIIKGYTSGRQIEPRYEITYVLDTTLPVTTGTYFFKNVEYDKYMQLDDGASNLNNDGIKTELWDFDGGTDQRWNIQYLHNGYYKITSAASGKALCTSSTSATIANASLEQYTYEAFDRQQWTITNVTGMFKLSPRNNSYYMAAGSGIGSGDGRNVEQRSAQSDNKDEWYLYLLGARTVNVEIVYDYAYKNRYSNASSRISDQVIILQEKYLSEFGITVNTVSLSLYASYADRYCSSNYSQKCNHADDDSCYDSVLYTDGNKILQSYHHNNIFNIMLRIPFPDTSSSVKVAYLGHDYCTASNHSSHPYYGLTYQSIGLAGIMNFGSVESETKTLIHEFGHFYGVEDHYGVSAPSTQEMINTTGNSGYSRYCIYGEEKESASVLSDFTICDGCKSKIEDNINLYNH